MGVQEKGVGWTINKMKIVMDAKKGESFSAVSPLSFLT
jgi:hypothetical protein